ncbi:Retrovirus-related Pol polyprotein from transposon 17.6 [Araneus ventricosus]|uniref:Retrovirus-related Pol polyprotein from transposon 17.6 n=1 Tax=Araneus ventricosus TaxID=182803 RepID=A0A4Y2M5A4_ARAVE|nr:Retrovirus-related Pol polyprotein from transposon 17.6 [Araneus ventricosus]
MLEKGICRPSRSNWASPLHMIPKGSTDWQPTGDYKALNRVTKQDKYPVPHLQYFSHYLKGKNIFSKIVLVREYHQIPVNPDDIEKTAFITPFGLFEFPHLNFGLCLASQTFQRFINEVLYGFYFCFAYIHDILVFDKDKTGDMQRLEQIFKRFVEYGITINESKCEFSKPQVDFLGHIISSEGILPMSSKVKAIQVFPKPETVS